MSALLRKHDGRGRAALVRDRDGQLAYAGLLENLHKLRPHVDVGAAILAAERLHDAEVKAARQAVRAP